MAYVMTNIDKATLFVAKSKLRIFSFTLFVSVVLALVGFWMASLSECSPFWKRCYFAPPAELLRGWHPSETDEVVSELKAVPTPSASLMHMSDDGGMTSVDLPPQTFAYWIDDHGMPVEGQPPAHWVWHVSMTVSSKAWTQRYWGSHKPCFHADPAVIRQVWTDVKGAVRPAPDYGAGSLEVTFTPVVDRPAGTVDGCFNGLPMPADASRVIRIKGYLNWYKAPDHTFTWASDLSFPPK